MIGYKLLREDLSSLRDEDRVYYQPGLTKDEPGPWQEVSGNGCYLAVSGGLLAGGTGPILARFESDDEPDVCSSSVCGVHCRRWVRMLGWWKWLSDELPPDVAERLLDDEDWCVRQAIAVKHRDLAERLLDDKNWHVRLAIAVKHRDLAERLLDDKNWHVRQAIAVKHRDLAEASLMIRPVCARGRNQRRTR